jgi:hypothetical protein
MEKIAQAALTFSQFFYLTGIAARWALAYIERRGFP